MISGRRSVLAIVAALILALAMCSAVFAEAMIDRVIRTGVLKVGWASWHPYAFLDPDTGHRLLFIEVPEEKQVKNRIHLDLRPRAGTRDDELVRLVAHGATEVADLRGKHGPGTGWVVLADPEGNEFCILRSEAEVAESRETTED